MYEYNYQEIGNRIREYRNNLYCCKSDRITISTEKEEGYKKMTQDDLLEYIKQNNLSEDIFSRQTLGKLENGEPSAYRIVKMEQWIALCKVFGCRVGHLLGEDEKKIINSDTISHFMGLSEEVIERLFQWSIIKPEWNKYISCMIEDPEFKEVMEHYTNLKATSDLAGKVIDEEESYKKNMKEINPDYDFEKDKEMQEEFKIQYAHINDSENASIYHIGRISGNIAKKIVNEIMIPGASDKSII